MSESENEFGVDRLLEYFGEKETYYKDLKTIHQDPATFQVNVRSERPLPVSARTAWSATMPRVRESHGKSKAACATLR